MDVSSHTIELISASKFHRSFFIKGTHSKEIARLVAVLENEQRIQAEVLILSLDSVPGGFEAQWLSAEIAPERLSLRFVTRDGEFVNAPLGQLMKEKLSSGKTEILSQNFISDVNSRKGSPRLLDLGGRDRSRIGQNTSFPNANCTVFDIALGDDVDVVGDAHELSKFFPSNHFDFIYCVSVFEHLFMPWKVVLEMNRVLKPGGRAYVATHQTIGVHDMPWDFWRFSIWTWEALFNRFTGFKIIDREMDKEQYVIPFVLTPNKLDAEKSAGFESAVVIVEKVGRTWLRWPVKLRRVLSTSYPSD